MRALVVYESMFGNTRTIAEAIGEGSSSVADTTVVEVGAAPDAVDDIDLLFVGGPTHVFGMSRAATRRAAVEQTTEPLVSAGRGIREWLDTVTGRPGMAAAFDTSIATPMPGRASGSAARRMRKLGFRLAPAESFIVGGTTGPIEDGEEARARTWAASIATEALHQSGAGRPG